MTSAAKEGCIFEITDATLAKFKTPLVFTAKNGDKIAAVLQYNINEKMLTSKKIWPLMRCNNCRNFYTQFAGLRFAEGLLFEGAPNPFCKLASTDKINFRRVFIIDAPLGIKEEGGFNHFYIDPKEKSELNTFTKEDYEWYLHQYTKHLLNILQRETMEGDKFIKTLDILLEILPKVKYGDELENCTKWLRDVAVKFLNYKNNSIAWKVKEKKMRKKKNINEDMIKRQKKLHELEEESKLYSIIIEALLSAPLSPGQYPTRIICTHIHQIKNVLSALKVAYNKNALIKLLEERLHPEKYQRPTTEATPAQIENAMEIFKNKNYKTSIMPVKNIIDYGGKLISHNVEDAMSYWSSRKNKNKNKVVKTASSFYDRANLDKPSTFRELFNQSPDGLEILTRTGNVVYLAEVPESARDLITHDFLWAFKNTTRPSEVGINNVWAKVSSIIFMGRKNVFIGIKGSKPNRNMGNCNIPEYLDVSIRRLCRKAFEELNTLPINISDDVKDFAIGLGFSRIDKFGTTHNKATFRIKGGESFTINLLGSTENDNQ